MLPFVEILSSHWLSHCYIALYVFRFLSMLHLFGTESTSLILGRLSALRKSSFVSLNTDTQVPRNPVSTRSSV